MSREQRPALWLKLDIGLAIVYAMMFALAVDLLFARMKKRKPNKLRTG